MDSFKITDSLMESIKNCDTCARLHDRQSYLLCPRHSRLAHEQRDRAVMRSEFLNRKGYIYHSPRRGREGGAGGGGPA